MPLTSSNGPEKRRCDGATVVWVNFVGAEAAADPVVAVPCGGRPPCVGSRIGWEYFNDEILLTVGVPCQANQARGGVGLGLIRDVS